MGVFIGIFLAIADRLHASHFCMYLINAMDIKLKKVLVLSLDISCLLAY